MLKYLKALALVGLNSALLCSCSVLDNSKETAETATALHNANFMLFDGTQGYCLSFDYDLILKDAATFIRTTDNLGSLDYVIDDTDSKGFIYRALLQKYNVRVSPYESDDSSSAFITFKENDSKTELFMLIETPYGSINRLYGKNAQQTFALSAFNFDATGHDGEMA